MTSKKRTKAYCFLKKFPAFHPIFVTQILSSFLIVSLWSVVPSKQFTVMGSFLTYMDVDFTGKRKPLNHHDS